MAISIIKYIKRSKILIFGLLLSCKAVPDIQGFDSVAWKNDINGCDGKRFLLSEPLENERKKLKGIAETDLTRLLGTPNEVQVMERQQKYYVYWIQNSKMCPDSTQQMKEVRIRLSAIDRVTEVIF